MKSFLLSSIFAAIFLLAAQPVQAQNAVDVVLFHGNTCPHCHEVIEYLDDLKSEYPQLEVRDYEVYAERDNIPIFMEYAAAYDVQAGAVPTLFIGDQGIIGANKAVIAAAIEECATNGCPSAFLALEDVPTPPPTPEPTSEPTPEPNATADPEESTDQPPLVEPHGQPAGAAGQAADSGADQKEAAQDKKNASGALTLTAVISGAAVDAINPCAFAVLIILITTVLGSSNRRRAALAGLAFSASVFISYYLMGLGLYSAVAAAGVSRVFYIIVSILAILIGMFNLKDWLWYGKWFVMEVPLSWRPRMQKIIRGVTSIPGAFAIGFLISLFLLPCTSGPYVVILGLLAKSASRGAALWYLALYNLVFVSPMLVITALITLGVTSTEKAEAWRQSKLRFLHLIAGIIILTLGVVMLGSLILDLI